MTQHDPKRRTQRQRESRRAERQQERHIANATLRAAVSALGAGCASDWNEDATQGQRASGGENGGGND